MVDIFSGGSREFLSLLSPIGILFGSVSCLFRMLFIFSLFLVVVDRYPTIMQVFFFSFALILCVTCGDLLGYVDVTKGLLTCVGRIPLVLYHVRPDRRLCRFRVTFFST